MWVAIPVGARDFFSKSSTPDVEPSLPSLLINAYRFFFRGVKGQVRDVDFSSPSSTEFKNKWKVFLCAFAYANAGL